MIDRIEIKNFKSIVDLKMELGRVNVIIGANGCGKTNILESISFASAANQDKLDNEFLFNRGIRVGAPEFMYSAFDDIDNDNKPIEINIYNKEKPLSSYISVIYSKEEKRWQNFGSFVDPDKMQFLIDSLRRKFGKEKKQTSEKFNDLYYKMVWDIKDENPDLYEKLVQIFISKPELDTFLVYAPDEYHLREVSAKVPISPLGVNGNGLLHYLKEVSTDEKDRELIENINEGLYLLDWFDRLSVPSDLLTNEYELAIEDKYLKDSLSHFDQRSTNEGFLYLLFYLTLFNSNDTPSFFAIDNIETSFNPKLCTHLIRHLIEVAKRNNKQVILTTHSPFVLDGLDLSDNDQRLFVARRNIDGHTKIEQIPHREDREMLLSELWMRGLIGGLPDNF